ncbi:MAG TPA: carboxypeptidase regulatory-like domain-containing protein, partial [Vicinamibacteria bacterium]|nr:carboxypeptidase regulatory-like domain-containing protein [Vicinamibacteria bacterium]
MVERIQRDRSCMAALVLAVAFLVPAASLAQVADATVEAVASDESGQVVPGATVTLSSPATGFTRSGVTSGAGDARFVAVPPGTYDLKFELAGFTTVVREGLVLRVGQTARVEAVLKVASVTETVTVTAESAPLVDVYKTDSSTNVVPEQIQALPVPDRDFQRLAFLTPGVQRERGGFRFIGGGPVIGAGGNASQATILVDGVDFTDPVLGLARARFSQDAIREFRVITNRFDTEIGGSAGGALSIITKTGTNDLSGSAFAFFRDDALRSPRRFEAQENPYSRQQFGFTLGGPLVKDRTHFFASLEQIEEDNVVLFRPGGAFAARASDLPVPVSQTLA